MVYDEKLHLFGNSAAVSCSIKTIPDPEGGVSVFKTRFKNEHTNKACILMLEICMDMYMTYLFFDI